MAGGLTPPTTSVMADPRICAMSQIAPEQPCPEPLNAIPRIRSG